MLLDQSLRLCTLARSWRPKQNDIHEEPPPEFYPRVDARLLSAYDPSVSPS